MDEKRRFPAINKLLVMILVGIIVAGVCFYKIVTYPVRVKEKEPPSIVGPEPETLIKPKKLEKQLDEEYAPRPDPKGLPKGLKEAYQGYEEKDVGKNISEQGVAEEEKVRRLEEIDEAVLDCEKELEIDPHNKQIENKLKLFRHLRRVLSGDFD